MRFSVGVVLAVLLVGCGQGERTLRVNSVGFGLPWSLHAEGVDDLTGEAVTAELEGWGAALSHWSESSDLMRFNRSRSTDWFPVDEKLVRAVRLAAEVAEETGGALDVTLGPLIDAWGFGPAGWSGELDESEIEALRQRCGRQHLQWRLEPPALKKAIPELEINVASVAEGLAMEGVAALLRADGARQWMLELGGEVMVRGPESREVAVQSPSGVEGDYFTTMKVANAAVCTSGTYRDPHEVGGVVVSHLIDPRTGRPVTHRLESVTVRHVSASLADAYATALLVLGPVEGRAVAERLGLDVIWIERAD